MTIEQTQLNGEPMVSMTVRQRDAMLYRIKELTSEVEMLRAKVAGMKLVTERTREHY